jgi:hypothetical protein
MPNDYQLMRALDEDAADELEDAEEIEQEISSPARWTQAILLLLGALGIQRLASFAPELIESFYSGFFYQFVGRLISIINQPFKFSLAEIGLILLVIALLVWLFWLFQKAWNGFISPLDVLAYLLYRAVWAGGIVMVVFLVLWGFNYQRQPLAVNLNLQGRETRPGELEAICSLVISRMNSSYDATRGKQPDRQAQQDSPAEAVLPMQREQLYKLLEASYQNLEILGRAKEGGFGNPKPLLLSPWLSRFGISGIYSPFTGEANYNEEAPPSDLPYVIAHEKAHQRGFAREDEANFVGFLACVNSTDQFVRYSGYLQAMPRVMNVLATTNEEQYRLLAARIGQGPRSDLQARAAFWQMREDRVLSAIARKSNDTFLRANRVRSGIANYDEVTALIINYFITYPNGGRERLPAPAAEEPRRELAQPVERAAPPLASSSPAAETAAAPEKRRDSTGGYIP